MKAVLSRRIWLIVTVLLLVSCGVGTDQAQRGVSEFRDRVSRRAFVDIHRAAAPEFRRAATEDQFVRFMTALDRKLGEWQFAADPDWNVAQGTGGRVVRLTYRSDFAKGAATEQFSWRIENGSAHLLGYHVTSPLLITD